MNATPAICHQTLMSLRRAVRRIPQSFTAICGIRIAIITRSWNGHDVPVFGGRPRSRVVAPMRKIAAAMLIPAVIATCPIMFSHAVVHAHPRPPSLYAQKYRPPAVGYAEAISAIDAATKRVKTLTMGQPMEFALGPANLRP